MSKLSLGNHVKSQDVGSVLAVARRPGLRSWDRTGTGFVKSVATVTLGGASLEEKLEAAARAGFSGVEICAGDLAACRLSPAQVRSLAASLGLQILLFQPFRDFESVPDEVLRANLARARRTFSLMAELGADMLLAVSNVTPQAIDDDARAVGQLCLLADLAAQHGVRVAYEALSWGRYVRDYQHAWSLVKAAAHPHLGLCIDTFHVLAAGGDPGPIRSIPGGTIFFLQLADAPRMSGVDLLTWSRRFRCLPGQGDFDLTGFAADVVASGYGGPWSLEIFCDDFRQADPRLVAADGMRSLLALEESLRLGPGDAEDTP
jgi:4-hydroxyphenylpyruvate dioxygenase